jgi:ribosome-associated toxin RatA of RatAB toxin-antitoxin module
MADVQKSVLLNYSAEQMYDLVTNVADYPDFLPWCGGVEIFEQTETTLDAKVLIHFNALKQFFHTRNTQTRPSHIHMTFADGPFKVFNGDWRFTPLREDACKIEFHLHYEFSSVLLEKIIGPVFSMIANTFVDSFVKRAEKVYGVG